MHVGLKEEFCDPTLKSLYTICIFISYLMSRNVPPDTHIKISDNKMKRDMH